MSKTFTREEVANHNKNNDAYIIIDSKVYDVTKFAMLHPGGKNILLNVAGQDASKEFDAFHKKSVLDKYSEKLCIGEIEGESGGMKTLLSGGKHQNPKYFGDLVPYGDPSWYQGHHTHYYNETHKQFRIHAREFTDQYIAPFCHEWEETMKFPKELHHNAFKAGLYPGSAGCWPTKYAGTNIAGGMKPEQWDYFHEFSKKKINTDNQQFYWMN
jgi:predicted heme/steroid binding protein